MADRYLLESSSTDGYLLEDGSGVLLLDAPGPFSDPSSISGLQAWYDADSMSGSDGSSVATITDRQGSFNASSVRTYQPILRHAQQNSRKIIDFSAQSGSGDGAGFEISSSLLNGATEGCYFVVAQTTADPPANSFYAGAFLDGFTSDAGGNKNSHTPYTDGNVYEHFGVTVRQTVGNPTRDFSSTYRIYCVHVTSGGTFTVFIDGVQEYQATGLTVGFGTGTRRFFYNFADSVIIGKFAEMPIYNVALSQSDREKIEGYLAHRWGIQANLDAGHPYKSTPPGGGTAYTLTAASGSFALTGTAATLKRGLKLTAAAGAYSLSGTAANLKKGYTLTAASGVFSLSGTAATLKAARKITAASGTFSLSGTAASLKRGLKVTAASGAFALTGTAATLTKSSVNNYTLTAASGSFALSGTAATLKRSLKLSAASGSYSLSGTSANLKRGLKLSAASGSYLLTGKAATLTKSTPNPVMTALPAAFVITGSPSTRRLNSAGGGGSIAFFLS